MKIRFEEMQAAWDELSKPAKVAAATILTIVVLVIMSEIVLLLERWHEGLAGNALFVGVVIGMIAAFWSAVFR